MIDEALSLVRELLPKAFIEPVFARSVAPSWALCDPASNDVFLPGRACGIRR